MPQMLLPMFTKEVTLINALIGYAKRDGRVYYFNGSMPLFAHNENDAQSFKMFMAQLYVMGNASQSEINKTFGMNPINMKRWVKTYQERGPEGFFKKERKCKPRVMTPEIIKKAQALCDENYTVKEVADELSIKIDTLHKAIREEKIHQSNESKKKNL